MVAIHIARMHKRGSAKGVNLCTSGVLANAP